MKTFKIYRMPPTTEKALEAEVYFGEVLRNMHSQKPERLAGAKAEPKRLAGGCLMYRFPDRRA